MSQASAIISPTSVIMPRVLSLSIEIKDGAYTIGFIRSNAARDYHELYDWSDNPLSQNVYGNFSKAEKRLRDAVRYQRTGKL